MKLRTRIMILCAAAFVAAVCISDVVIWNICKNTLTDGALKSAYAESYAVFVDFTKYTSFLHEKADKNTVEYFFKSSHDDYTVCADAATGEEYYNHTVFSAGELNGKKIKIYADDAYFSYSVFRWEGRSVICFYRSTNGALMLYHLTDISPVVRQTDMLGVKLALLSVIICATVSVLFYFIVRHSLSPLVSLSEKARLISDGKYDERITLDRHDEVGLLVEDFNKMAQAIERHTREISESEEKKTFFMGMLAHELKTPLTAISGYAQTMQRVKLSAEDSAEALYYIRHECARLSKLSGKIMHLLELEHGAELSLETVEVHALFDTVKKSCSDAAKSAGVEIRTDGTDFELLCDADLMTDALINLTDNAIRASGEGSCVWLYTEKTENGFVIAVKDRGCGIPKDESERIFEPFYMIDKSRSRKSGGAGLGLSLVSLILKKHGFTITVESQVRKGTVMRIYIPIKSR